MHENVGNANENPPDIGIRGCTASELNDNSLWWHGPKWLTSSSELWPKPVTFKEPSFERKTVNFHTDTQIEDILDRFFDRALRVLCYMYRFIRKCRKIRVPETHTEFITKDEIEFVKFTLIRQAQREYYATEYNAIEYHMPLNSKSRLLALNPKLDDNGLLRVNGRLSNADLSYNERFPIILPEKSRFCKLFVEYTHKLLLHSEHQVMLRAIRQVFYIIRLKSIIRHCIRNCRTCTIFKSKIRTQIMSSLLSERCTFSLLFTHTGVDFAVPFEIKTSGLRNAKFQKGYAAIFVCMSTRAVHLEACSELTTEAFLSTFNRFTGRRGFTSKMFSDNGTNFVGASRALATAYKIFLKNAQKSTTEKYNLHWFSWHFIPPHAPHVGGLWESAVKSMKSHLRKVASNLKFTFEEFSTLLVRIESILNSPISPINEDPFELNPLTPGHLLRGSALVAVPEEYSDNLSLLNRWQRLKTLQMQFAKRWKSEYLLELQRRYKWKTAQKNLRENDFCYCERR
ncbi:uncharacterized protein LOC142230200 [Haematobia irritans]|uniref:uncharacterized protein LOC142230200 n=1 Tax=Haematobia irritans TaxID=7368 RepID=UPI003F4FE9B6